MNFKFKTAEWIENATEDELCNALDEAYIRIRKLEKLRLQGNKVANETDGNPNFVPDDEQMENARKYLEMSKEFE